MKTRDVWHIFSLGNHIIQQIVVPWSQTNLILKVMSLCIRFKMKIPMAFALHVHYVYRASLVRMPSTYLDDQAFLSCALIASDLFSYYHDSGCLLSEICWCVSDTFLRMLLQSVLPTTYLLVSISFFLEFRLPCV